MATKMFKSVILGAPGSGKGTISSRIVKAFNLHHISSGDLLRLSIKNKEPIGLEAQKYMKNGQLVPDDVMVNFVHKQIKKAGGTPWLLDGFPRTLAQSEALWKLETLDVALNLVVPFDVIIERLKNRWVHLPSGRVYNLDFNAPKVPGKDDVTGEDLIQREDDKPEVVRKRLEQYESMTKPVIEFYKQKGILKSFHGNTSDEIWPQVLECLATYIPLQITTEKLRRQ